MCPELPILGTIHPKGLGIQYANMQMFLSSKEIKLISNKHFGSD